MSDANIRAVITAKDQASSTLKGFGKNINALSVAAGVAIAAAGAAAIKFGVDSVKAFSESEDAISQTNAVLKSTGGVAGVTAKQVDELSKSWQKQSKFSDEAVRGAENILLTFTKIGQDKFPQATEAVLNMSSALHEDLQSASIQVGKALQDPILGITALRRVGVNFNDEQKKTVKHLVETGHQAKAQALILKELQTEFGGSAKAAGETFSGKLEILKNRLNDVQEVIGKKLITVLESLAKAFSWLQDHPEVAAAIIGAILGIATAITVALMPVLIGAATAFAGAALAAAPFIIAGAAIGFLALTIYKHWSGITSFFANIWKSIKAGVSGITDAIVSPFQKAFDIIKKGITEVRDLFNRVKTDITGAPGKVVSGATSLFHKLTPFASGGFTGTGSASDIAGVVHKGEYVIPKSQVNQSTGQPMMGSSPTINVSFNGIFTGNQQEFRKLAVQVFKAYDDAKGMGTI